MLYFRGVYQKNKIRIQIEEDMKVKHTEYHNIVVCLNLRKYKGITIMNCL